MTSRPPHRRRDWQELRRRLVRRLFTQLADVSAASSTLLPAHGIGRILVIRPNHRLGNVVLLTPLLADLERAYPDACIDLLVSGGIAAQALADGYRIDTLHTLPRHALREPRRLWRTLRQLRAARYDLAIDPSVGSQSGRLLLLFARARFRLGFAEAGQRGSLTHGVPVPAAPRHMAQLPVYLLRAARGEPFAATRCPPLDLRLSAIERAQGEIELQRRLGPRQPGQTRIGLFVEATGAKAFPIAWWQTLHETLAQCWPSAAFFELAPVDGRPRLAGVMANFHSPDVRKVAAVLAGLDRFISADCGVMHLAVASGVPTAGLFSVTDLATYAPCGDGHFALETGNRTAFEVATTLATRCESLRPADARVDAGAADQAG
jgi:ADP-heptose:LPS heptosyltransferase